MPQPQPITDKKIAIDTGGETPSHVAIIMDGNGRWAKARHMPRIFGHNAGIEALRKSVTAAIDLGVKTLSVYAFSTENWRRPKDEIEGLFALLRQFVKQDLARLKKDGVRVRVQGLRDDLTPDLRKLIEDVEIETKDNSNLTLVICFNYGGQAEIINATQLIAKKVKAGEINPEDIDEKLFEKYLLSADWPHPDLIIRTAGEKRLSNFLMWQSAYSEFVFSDILWPDFGAKELEMAINEFKNRKRRFGGL